MCSGEAPIFWGRTKFLKCSSLLFQNAKRHKQKNPVSAEPFLNGESAQYVEAMYNAWLRDPASVHVSWDTYFRLSAYQRPPTLAGGKNKIPLNALKQAKTAAGIGEAVAHKVGVMPHKPVAGDAGSNSDECAVYGIIRSYQYRGHKLARINPLEDATVKPIDSVDKISSFIRREYNLKDKNMDKVYQLPESTFIGGREKALPLREIINRLENCYCGTIGVEFMYTDNKEGCDWLKNKLETPGAREISREQKRLTLARLIRATAIEEFVAKKFSAKRRFSLEGTEAFVPSLKSLIDKSTELGVQYVLMGMAHRGRVNALANVCHCSLSALFNHIAGKLPMEENMSSDVIYHVGISSERENPVTKKKIKTCLLSNPSHLITANPLVLGKAKAEQVYAGDKDGKKIMPIIIYGDAAMCGQGLVYEMFQWKKCENYGTKGIIHMVINNQVGFTTESSEYRSSNYSTCVAKVVNCPIFHVNSDDPDSVVFVSNLAAEWRAKFHKDVVIDILGYRRAGHNETDDPFLTSPLMYQKVAKTVPIVEKYGQKLVNEKIVTEAEIQEEKQKYLALCEAEFSKSEKETHINHTNWLDSPWPNFPKDRDNLIVPPTGVKEDVLAHIGKVFASPPKDPKFVIHKLINRVLKGRMDLLQKRIADWSMGEALAFGTLLKEGIHVRVSGEDVQRGTFNNRHHVLHDQVENKTYNSLENLYPDQAKYTISNSPLSEYGILGFELGYSLANPNSLVIWEAQFGDFVNVPQVTIDTILNCQEAKFMRQSGLVLYLPHALEGQGPEHASCRLERFLQLTDDDCDVSPPDSDDFAIRQLKNSNWIVANCTTPANYFHILRRQVALPFRKPLILLAPKSLLRNTEARSSFDEMLEGTQFQRIIPDNGPASKNPQDVKKLIFCDGKVYYDIKDVLKNSNLEDKVAVVRIEQIFPFPFDLLKIECAKYPNANVAWCQLEHKNQGAYLFVRPRFYTFIPDRYIHYIGRPAAAATSPGNASLFKQQQEQLLEEIVKFASEG